MVAELVCSAVTEMVASWIVAKTTVEIDEDGEKEIQMTDVQSDGKENAKVARRGTERGLVEFLESV